MCPYPKERENKNKVLDPTNLVATYQHDFTSLFFTIFLNLVSEQQFFMLSSTLFHSLTPNIDRQFDFIFDLQNLTLKLPGFLV